MYRQLGISRESCLKKQYIFNRGYETCSEFRFSLWSLQTLVLCLTSSDIRNICRLACEQIYTLYFYLELLNLNLFKILVAGCSIPTARHVDIRQPPLSWLYAHPAVIAREPTRATSITYTRDFVLWSKYHSTYTHPNGSFHKITQDAPKGAAILNLSLTRNVNTTIYNSPETELY